MRLDDRQLAFYRTFGFLRFPALFADEIGEITAAFERIDSSGYPRGHVRYFEDVQDYIRTGDLFTNKVYWVAPRTQPA